MTTIIEKNHVIEVITNSSLRRMLEKAKNFSNLIAQDILSQEPKFVQRKSLAIKSAEIVDLHNIGQLIVMDKKNYHGIINSYDLLKK